jgi:ribonuclease HII
VRDSRTLTQDAKDRLIREIMEHETTHGQCTQT